MSGPYAYESLADMVREEGQYVAYSQPDRGDGGVIYATTFTRAENPTNSPYEANSVRVVVRDVRTGDEVAVVQFDMPELIEALQALP